jgi:hypothetical protein
VLIIGVGCQYLPVKERTFFSEKEEEVLEKTTPLVGMDYGYDSEIELYNVFQAQKDLNIGRRNEKEVYNILMKLNKEEQAQYYTKIYELLERTEFLLGYYYKYKRWKYYNYIDKTLLPPLKEYVGVVETQISQHHPALYKQLVARKPDIKRDAILFYYDKFTIVDEY